MSELSNTFLEMVRNAYAAAQAGGRIRKYWCPSCCKDTEQTMTPAGDYDKFKCNTCGTVQSVRVK
jgi:predicted RNA-binding Zn-ribbon protein involved in translation (DUF1610 family)